MSMTRWLRDVEAGGGEVTQAEGEAKRGGEYLCRRKSLCPRAYAELVELLKDG